MEVFNVFIKVIRTYFNASLIGVLVAIVFFIFRYF